MYFPGASNKTTHHGGLGLGGISSINNEKIQRNAQTNLLECTDVGGKCVSARARACVHMCVRVCACVCMCAVLQICSTLILYNFLVYAIKLYAYMNNRHCTYLHAIVTAVAVLEF